MKRSDVKKLHGLSIAELQKKLVELTLHLAKAKLEKKVGKIANPRSVSMMSDDVARIKTVLKQKEMEA
jgi:ribosomal protein L29